MPKPDALRAANRLLVDATLGTTAMVEAVHASVLGWPRRLVGLQPRHTTGGIPGLVYASVRGIAGLAGTGVDRGLRRRPAPAGDDDSREPRREAVRAALNGVIGDHLVATGNPLAITARLRYAGRAMSLQRDALAREFPAARPRLLVLVHGLCMNDLQWQQGDGDLGVALARDLNAELLHLHYNSGMPIDDNGRTFDALLQSLVGAWPVPVERLVLVGHSMGGLVARAAVASAQAQGNTWLPALDALVTLGTPYHGAPLERAGDLLERALGASAHSRPFRALGRLRSSGIRDLRHGGAHLRQPALPARVRAFAVAASTQAAPSLQATRHPRGDGLVPVASAFGEHRDPRRRLALPEDHKLLVHGTGHIALLGNAEVQTRLRRWLA